MTDKLLNLIKNKYPLVEIDVGDMGTLKASGMKFTVCAYQAEGLGHISVMKASGFFGLMKMGTLIINPKEIDLPLYSYDRIYAAGNDTLIVELYDTLSQKCDFSHLNAVKANYTDISERDTGEHWYDSLKLPESISKKGKKRDTEVLDILTALHFSAYLDAPVERVTDDAARAAKAQKAAAYVDGLLREGGPSTDVFKQSLGEETTARLFRSLLFGTAI